MFGRSPGDLAPASPTAEDTLFTEYATAQLPALRRLAHRLCGDPHRADDIVQIALTRLCTRWAAARRADDVDAYVGPRWWRWDRWPSGSPGSSCWTSTRETPAASDAAV